MTEYKTYSVEYVEALAQALLELQEEHGDMNVQNVKDEKEIERLTARNKLLEDVAMAGNRLQNEVHGSLHYLDRSVCGNTNYVCLQTAAIATREAIAKLQEHNDA